MKTSKAVRGIRTLKEIKERPVGFLIELILETILSALIPIPFVAQIVVRYKGMILWGIGGALVTGIAVLALILSVIFYPLTIFHGGQGTSPVTIGLSGSLPAGLLGYIEAGFSDTDIPQRNPLGGNGMTNSIITMDYHDPNYHFFDGVHTGIDLVPSQTYYDTNKAYKITGQLVVFATMNGKGMFAVDQYGANYVDVVNSENTMLTRYVHLATSFIATGKEVKAGQPIGIMGQTGEATGVHLHYELRTNQGGIFQTVDPKGYIH